MNAAQLTAFRDIAEQMIGTAYWQWIGPHMSQRMFGITRERAEAYAHRHGGTAMPLAFANAGGTAAQWLDIMETGRVTRGSARAWDAYSATK
jgi:hypothetical protein